MCRTSLYKGYNQKINSKHSFRLLSQQTLVSEFRLIHNGINYLEEWTSNLKCLPTTTLFANKFADALKTDNKYKVPTSNFPYILNPPPCYDSVLGSGRRIRISWIVFRFDFCFVLFLVFLLQMAWMCIPQCKVKDLSWMEALGCLGAILTNLK